MRTKPDPGDLAFLGSTFIEERDGRALVRLPNGSKTSLSYDALRAVGGPVHFVDNGADQVTVHCQLCDWSNRTTRRVLAEDAWMVHFRAHDQRGPQESPPISDAELDEMVRRADAAAPAPWEPFVEGRDHTSGDDFIRTGGLDDSQPDMYVSLDGTPAPPPVLDFIGHARQDVPRLVAEVRRLQRRLAASSGAEPSGGAQDR